MRKCSKSGKTTFPVILLAVLLMPLARGMPQIITRITPEVAAPGDIVIVSGSFLGGASLEFQAIVGGFVGVWTAVVTPLSSSANQLVAVVPQMAGFAPPNATPPGNPVGTVKALSPAAPTGPNTLPFFFLQALPGVTTVGTGTTQSAGIGKPVIAFTISGGPPVPGNASFVLTLENALPFSSAWLVLGFPDAPPHIGVGDGVVMVDVLQPFVVFPSIGAPPLAADMDGDLLLPLPVPAAPPPGSSFVLQWLLSSNPGHQLAVSNGLLLSF